MRFAVAFAALLASASSITSVLATETTQGHKDASTCKTNEFFWERLCLLEGETRYPQGKCEKGFYVHPVLKICVPQSAKTKLPTCKSTGCKIKCSAVIKWMHNSDDCKPKTVNGIPGTAPINPPTKDCSAGYKLDVKLNTCVRIEVVPTPHKDCGKGYKFDVKTMTCIRITEPHRDCGKGFKFDVTTMTCIRIDDKPHKDCGDGYKWDTKLHICVRINDGKPPRECHAGYRYDVTLDICVRISPVVPDRPEPSHKYGTSKRQTRRIRSAAPHN
ncbi:hypothetical protein FRC03_005351 [Tulasnella sp. 419]|nr:hypothetical protein FRC02_010476 [Tulasnella sp. 418]KAG8961462.1 hypothetical protein FRC03_005351 [Tulasnella sp. 419]